MHFETGLSSHIFVSSKNSVDGLQNTPSSRPKSDLRSWGLAFCYISMKHEIIIIMVTKRKDIVQNGFMLASKQTPATPSPAPSQKGVKMRSVKFAPKEPSSNNTSKHRGDAQAQVFGTTKGFQNARQGFPN